MATQCTALNLDERRCKDEATNVNGLFCRYHGKRVQGLYIGYKTRNKRLDRLNDESPTYLAKDTPLRNVDFQDVEDETTLDELHEHLFQKYALLDKVIKARNFHHKYS